jgi:hypothetical protein
MGYTPPLARGGIKGEVVGSLVRRDTSFEEGERLF